MTRIVLDGASASKLLNLTESVELCDESGCVLGQFLPVPDLETLERALPELSEEELERRRHERSYTTEEVLAHLERLEKP